MADIFISYAREDTKTAERLAVTLENRGWSVFWDQQIGAGESFPDVIAKELETAHCVVVLWSRAAYRSDWVLDEAGVGRRRKILAPALIEPDIEPPLGFGRFHAANLVGWQGESTHAGFRRLLKDIARYITAPPVPSDDPQPVGGLVSRVSRHLAFLIPKSRLVRYEIVLACLGASLFYAYLILSVQPRPCRWEASELSKA